MPCSPVSLPPLPSSYLRIPANAINTDPTISSIDAPVDANVWKILVEEGQEVGAKTLISILEAMKLEINVNAADDQGKAKVEKLLVQPGETIKAGGRIALLRNEG